MMKRYIKNMNALSYEEVEILNKSKVCIIGCGGLGGYIIELLSRIGVGNMTIVDGDVFDETNLNRQILCNTENIGRNKAREGKKRIKLINPTIKVKAIDEIVNKSNIRSIITNHDVIVDALDNIETRLLLQETSKKLNMPMVHGAIAGFYGQVTTILPGDNTLDILYPETFKDKKGIEEKLGNLSFTASLIAAIEVSEIIKLLINKGNILRKKVLFIDTMDNSYKLVQL